MDDPDPDPHIGYAAPENPPHAWEARRRRPPAALNRFVGRSQDLARLEHLLLRPDVRLVTLVGPGGVGKTRLALEIARRANSARQRSICFVPLETVTSADEVPGAVSQALGFRECAPDEIGRRLGAEGLPVLLILDNFEQVVESAGFVTELLLAAPLVLALVTSREPLQMTGEHVFSVAPLPIPDPNTAYAPQDLMVFESVTLFFERASAAKVGFELTDGNAEEIAAICARLDGLPLALELAAAQAGLISPPAMRQMIDRKVGDVGVSPRDAPARQRTMRSAVGWSYELLAEPEQRTFRRLTAFSGGFRLWAAERVASAATSANSTANASDGVWESILSLAQKNLVIPQDQPGDDPRFSMLETIRRFGRSLLDQDPDRDSILSRHAHAMQDLAEMAEPYTLGEVRQIEWLNAIDSDYGNFLAALEWSLENDPDLALDIAGSLVWYWYVRGRAREGYRWLNQVLAAASTTDSPVRARALLGMGLLNREAPLDTVLGFIREGFEVAERIGDQRRAFLGLSLRGSFEEDAGEIDLAEQHFMEAMAIAADPVTETMEVLRNTTRVHLAVIAWTRGEAMRADSLLDDALVSARRIKDRFGIANALGYIGLFASLRNRFSVASAALAENLALVREVGSPENAMEIIANVAVFATRQRHYESCARLLGVAMAMRDRIGGRLQPPERDIYEEAAARARREMGGESFNAAFAEGLAVEPGRALDEALAVIGAEATATSAAQARETSGLTERELEVLSLLFGGVSDQEIADTLFISRRTAQVHVAHILAKLDVNSRTAAVTAAAKLGLVEI